MTKEKIKKIKDTCPLCGKIIMGYYVKLVKGINIHHECYLKEILKVESE